MMGLKLRGHAINTFLTLAFLFSAGRAESAEPAPIERSDGLETDELSADRSLPSPFTALGQAGLVDGLRIWLVPDTPNGLHPNQSWFSVGGSPDGSIYVTGQDHKTNSALYRLRSGGNVLRYVGDARAASEAASNWLPGETAEKFHVRPRWYKGRVYVVTADYSNQDDLYLNHRGFHWYAYGTRTNEFVDLSAREPGGVGAEHISIFSTALDEKRGLLYGLGSPTSHLYQYNIATGVTVDLGRSPLLTRPYYNPGRFIWLDESGRVHLTVATAGTLAPGEPATPLYVLYWDPAQGWGAQPNWTIAQMLRTGQWSADHRRCYILDYPLNLYVYDDDAKTFTKLTQGILDAAHTSPRTRSVRVRSMNLSPNEKKIYFVSDTAPVNSLFEWDFRNTDTPRELLRVEGIDPRLDARYSAYTGSDSWDNDGRFYFTGFGGEDTGDSPDLYFVGADPVRIKAALGRLPGLSTLSLRRGEGRDLAIDRTGDASTKLEVILEGSLSGSGDPVRSVVTLEAGSTRMPLLGQQFAAHSAWRIVPDGDTYLVKTEPR